MNQLTKKQEAAKGDDVERKQMAAVSAQNYGSQMRKNRKHDRISLAPNYDTANVEFVGDIAMILSNLNFKPNKMELYILKIKYQMRIV